MVPDCDFMPGPQAAELFRGHAADGEAADAITRRTQKARTGIRKCPGSLTRIFSSKANAATSRLSPGSGDADGIATADVVRGEFLLGVHAVADEKIRQRGVQFYSERIAGLPSFSSEPADYAKAAALAGDARRSAKGKPGLIDGLIAAIAIRTAATVATQNTKDFDAMGCPLCKSTGVKLGGGFTLPTPPELLPCQPAGSVAEADVTVISKYTFAPGPVPPPPHA